MKAMSRHVENFYRENGSIIGMLSRGIRKALAFVDETLVSNGIIDEEWNSTSPKSSHGKI